MMKQKIILLILSIFLISFIGCSIKHTPEDEYSKLAKKAYRQERFNDAWAYYRLLIAFYPDSPKMSQYKEQLGETLIKLAQNSNKSLSKTYLDEIKSFGSEADTLIAWLDFQSASKLTNKKAADSLFKSLDFRDYLLAAQYALDRAKYNDALKSYDKALEIYPSNPMGYKAAFLAGFICSEYLKDTVRARPYYQFVIDKYPNSDLSDDARWSIKNMGKSPDELNFAGASDTTKTK
ncbi:tetratricopeptide repeat protein [bacterium]|nr:tetratricopeptide repeat protein [bacterium]